ATFPRRLRRSQEQWKFQVVWKRIINTDHPRSGGRYIASKLLEPQEHVGQTRQFLPFLWSIADIRTTGDELLISRGVAIVAEKEAPCIQRSLGDFPGPDFNKPGESIVPEPPRVGKVVLVVKELHA